MKPKSGKYIFLLLIVNCSLLISQLPTQQWAARYVRPSGSSSIPNQLALDKVGNCYVLGNIPINAGVGGILTVKYNSSGDTVWTRTHNIGSGSTFGNVGITADSIGNVYITGFVGFGFGPFDIVVIKYDVNGNQVWLKTYAGAGNVSDTPGGIKLGRDGMIYVGGNSGNNSVLIKYKPAGDTSWTRIYAQAGFISGVGYLEFDSKNNIYAGGNRENLSTFVNYYHVLKYDSAGSLVWGNSNFTINGSEVARDMTIDRFGNCFITGDGQSGYTTVKYDSSGNQQWVKTYTNNIGEQARGIVADQTGNAYVTGRNTFSPGNSDYLTIKYNPIGDSVWCRRFNGTANSGDAPNDIIGDDSSNIYITGSVTSAGNILEYGTIKYNSCGILIWEMRYPGIGQTVGIDMNRNVFVTGRSDSAGFPGYVTIKYSQPVSLIAPISNVLPDKYLLSQNYPNPFNPSSKFKIQAPRLSTVKLTIFDILGREIGNIVNEMLKPGTYEISFDGTNYPSGVYFYQLIADNNIIDTKKFIIVK